VENLHGLFMGENAHQELGGEAVDECDQSEGCVVRIELGVGLAEGAGERQQVADLVVAGGVAPA
jgi:hypothetical protein